MMNLGMWYVWNMHESCVSKIHPFSGHAKQDIETVMKRCCGPWHPLPHFWVIHARFHLVSLRTWSLFAREVAGP